jgi:hypothetical protein
VKAVLQGKTPAEVAKEALGGTKLKDVAARTALVQGGKAAGGGGTPPRIARARPYDRRRCWPDAGAGRPRWPSSQAKGP